MPTRLCLPLLLATLAPALAVSEETDLLVPHEAFSSFRPGAVSSGPASARRVDAYVEPVLFQSVGEPKAIPTPQTDQLESSDNDRQTVSTTEPEPTEELVHLDLPTEPEPIEPLAVATPIEASDDNGRRLLGTPRKKQANAEKSQLPANPLQSLIEWRPSSQTLTATGGGLAIAIGLLLATTWLIRSCAPKSSRPLPREVVEVLGRLPLGGKQTTQLVRVGSKLVLVAITPDGAETLTEITDPDEVARLVAACDAKTGRGSTADFDRLLEQMSDQRTTPGFLDDRDAASTNHDAYGFADGAFDPRSLAAAYANTPGGRGDG